MVNRIAPGHGTVLLISPDEAFCGALRAALGRTEPPCHVASVASFPAARRAVADISPDVIVLDDSSLQSPRSPLGSAPSPLEDVVAALAAFAPVVLFSHCPAPPSLSALIAAGAADFVPGAEPASAVAACVEKRLRRAWELIREMSSGLRPLAAGRVTQLDSFGELLRHELNNPLTGILGNAELLLAEARRHNGSHFSENGLKRLETIASLAVRMRETVRRLSRACEARSEQVRSA